MTFSYEVVLSYFLKPKKLLKNETAVVVGISYLLEIMLQRNTFVKKMLKKANT